MARAENPRVRTEKKPGAGDAPGGGDGFLSGFKIRPKAFRWMAPSDLKPHPMNWKTHPDHQLGEIEKSLEEFGWVPSMIALMNERTGHMIDAHGRISAAMKSGRKIPVAVIDVDEKTELRILASLDKIGELHDRDFPALAELLSQLEGDMPPGYDDDALEMLTRALEIPAQLPPVIDVGENDPYAVKDAYLPGTEVTCPHCRKKFKLE